MQVGQFRPCLAVTDPFIAKLRIAILPRGDARYPLKKLCIYYIGLFFLAAHSSSKKGNKSYNKERKRE